MLAQCHLWRWKWKIIPDDGQASQIKGEAVSFFLVGTEVDGFTGIKIGEEVMARIKKKDRNENLYFEDGKKNKEKADEDLDTKHDKKLVLIIASVKDWG